jgi:hypothetical protein
MSVSALAVGNPNKGSAVDTLRPQALAKGLAIKTEIDPGSEDGLVGDPPGFDRGRAGWRGAPPAPSPARSPTAEFVENFLADERAWMRRGHCYSGGCTTHQ